MQRLVVTATFILLLPVLAVLWLLLGIFSMHELGKVMEKTGQNLKDYNW